MSHGFILVAILMGLAGFAAFLNWLLQQPQFSLDPAHGGIESLRLIWRLLEPLLAYSAAFAVHEIGHTIAGKLVGFRFVMMRLGPLHMALPLRMKWIRENPLPGAAGFVIMVPKGTRYLRSRSIFMLLGGPVANLASYGIAPHGSLFLGWFALLSAFIGIFNLIPLRDQALVSDGMRIFMLIFHSQRGNRWLALMQLQADLRRGVEPVDLKIEFIRMAIAVQDASRETVRAHTIAYSMAFYKKDFAEAARLLEVCLKYSNFATPAAREAIFTDAATFQATRRKRIDLAGGWLNDLPEKTIIPGRRVWIEAAILEAQGDIQGALKKLDEVETQICSQVRPERHDAYLKGLRRWRSELREKTNYKLDGVQSDR